MTYWKFDCKVQCPNFCDFIKQELIPAEAKHPFKREYLQFVRRDLKDKMNFLTITCVEQNITTVKRLIHRKCADKNPVPNIVHYIWFGPLREFQFYQFLSVYSAHKFLRPCLILFHGETLPYGKYWTSLTSIVPNIVHICRKAPTKIEGIDIEHIEHKADIARFQVLKEFGGIYFDTDSVVLKALDPLRIYNFTLSTENPGILGIGTILSAPRAKFLDIWLKHYITFNPKDWGLHSVILPYRLSKKYPKLIHIENKTFYYAGSGEKLFEQNMRWNHMYAMHLSMRYYTSYVFDELAIRQLNTTLGAVSRYILYNSKELCSS